MKARFYDCDQIWINAKIAPLQATTTPEWQATPTLSAIGINGSEIHIVTDMASFEQEKSLLPSHIHIEDAQAAWVTPGLIDAHTHAVYAGNRAKEFEQRLLGYSYTDIANQGGGILSTVRATRKASLDELVDTAGPRIQYLIREGVTTLEIKSGYGLNRDTEIKMLQAMRSLAHLHPIRIRSTLLAAHAIPPEFAQKRDQYIRFITEELIPEVVDLGLADAIDVFCESIAFNPDECEHIFQAAVRAGLNIHVHAEQLSNQQGARLASRYGALSADHLEYIDEASVAAMAASGTLAVILPLAFYYLREKQRPPIELFRQYGVPMVVASDLNPGSAPLGSLRLAMNMACVLFNMTVQEVLAGTTHHAASALGLNDLTGKIAAGYSADFLVWDLEELSEIPCHFGVNRLTQRIFAGNKNHA